jgi:hypothetical protein
MSYHLMVLAPTSARPSRAQLILYWLAARWYEHIGPGRGDAVDSLGLDEQDASAAGFVTYLNLMLGQLRTIVVYAGVDRRG